MNIKTLIDLTMPITSQTPVYPGDPKPKIEPAATFAQDGYHVSRLVLGSHSGTHVDAPFHFYEHGWRLDDVPLTYFLGRGVVINATGKAEGEAVTMADALRISRSCRREPLCCFIPAGRNTPEQSGIFPIRTLRRR